MLCATAKPKVTNIDKKRIPAEEDTTSINIQLNPSKIKYVATAKGNVKKGKINERHRYPAEESPFLHKIKEITIESISSTAKGMTI
jgi:hypothetical protein|tara:strand:+ start:56 stop:313 length:258 start_codon:yes stop_codon:yes gene_type:complete